MFSKSNSGNQESKQYDKIIRCCIVGDSSSGKTTLAHAMAQEPIANHYTPTIGINFKKTLLDYNNTKVKVVIMDFSGEERYQLINKSHYRGADLIFYILDISDDTQLGNISKRLKEIEENAHRDIPIILVGNIPLDENARTIGNEAILEVARQNSLLYIELNIYNYDDVRRLLLLALSKIFLKDNDEGLDDISKIDVLGVDHELNNDLAIYAKENRALEDYLGYVPKINILITRSTLNPKHNSMCYSAKLILMRNIFGHVHVFSNLELLPNLFVEYMDAIGGFLHHSVRMDNDLVTVHMSLLIRFFERVNNNPYFQGETIKKIDEFYCNASYRYFPNDSIFHPLITCKLLGWMQKKPASEHLIALRQLPYFGQNQHLINHIISEMICKIRLGYKNKSKDLVKSINDQVHAIQKYLEIQQRIISHYHHEFSELKLIELKLLRYAIPPSDMMEASLWKNLKYLESAFEATSPALKSRFLDELNSIQCNDEAEGEFLNSRALARFLMNDIADEMQNDISDISLLQSKSFENLVNDYSIMKKSDKQYAQKSFDLIFRFIQLMGLNSSIILDQVGLVSTAVSHLIDCAQVLEVDDDIQLGELAILLAEFISKHWDIGRLVACVQNLMVIENEFSRSLCGYIIAYHMSPIFENESLEHYLERLSGAVSLFGIYKPLQQHYSARMILLINAEEIIQRAVTEYSLTPKDFHVPYGNLAMSPEQSLLVFTSTRKDTYLNALCRCYRQTSSLIISSSHLLQQYLVVFHEKLIINTENNTLITNIIEEQISVKELIFLIQGLSSDHLQILADHHLASILKGFYNNARELCSTINSDAYCQALSLLLSCVKLATEQYAIQVVPQLSKIVFRVLTESLPELGEAQYLQQGMEIVSSLIKYGANVFYLQIIGLPDNLTPTHTILSLLNTNRHKILINFLELYRNNPENIIDNGVNDYIDQNPLFLAITNKGNRQLIRLMLELGFSCDLVYAYLAEEHDAQIMEKAKLIMRNIGALQQLCLFSHKKLKSISIDHSLLEKKNTSIGFFK